MHSRLVPLHEDLQAPWHVPRPDHPRRCRAVRPAVLATPRDRARRGHGRVVHVDARGPPRRRHTRRCLQAQGHAPVPSPRRGRPGVGVRSRRHVPRRRARTCDCPSLRRLGVFVPSCTTRSSPPDGRCRGTRAEIPCRVRAFRRLNAPNAADGSVGAVSVLVRRSTNGSQCPVLLTFENTKLHGRPPGLRCPR